MTNSEYKYWLPNADNEKVEYTSSTNAVIIIGANGSGKSKLGAWIEQQELDNIHRVGAQRNLNFSENIALKNYSQAEDFVFYGTDDSNHKRSKGNRWNWGKQYTTKLLDDFEYVLAALIALKNNENDEFIKKCKKAEHDNKLKPNVPITVVDKLQLIWREIFPQRKLEVEDSKFLAVVERNDQEYKYSANQMSDGERAVLYLTAQVLCVPDNKTLIIDEPEVHLHRSIMNRLWATLEKYRKDCLFIYITHDTQFAASHTRADKFWIQEYDGKKWKIEKIVENDLPEDLLLDILGNRKSVLFVEGERNSYDTQLYSEIYPKYYIVPCGSCTQVISRTKAFKNNPILHHCFVYGIIDRDYRSDYEIEKYKSDNIYTLNVAEVENLFIVEELINTIAEHLGKVSSQVFSDVKKYVIDERFGRQLTSQICQSTVAQIKYKLSCCEIDKNNEIRAKENLNSILESINFDSIYSEQEVFFKSILSDGTYGDVIKVFNEKNISKSIGHFFGISNSVYCSMIIDLLKTNKRQDIIDALIPYFPTEISRD